MASSLRNQDWLLGYSYCTSLATASKLPTKGVVLSRFLAIQQEIGGATDIYLVKSSWK
jgi:hypothetical protein